MFEVSILKKLFGQQVPEWASSLSFEEYQEFQDDITREVQSVTSEAEFLWEEGKVKFGNNCEKFLHNLVAKWKERQGAARRDMVRKAVAGLIQVTEVLNLDLDFDKLAFRIYDFQSLQDAPFLIRFPIGKHLSLVLVQDLPDTVVSVQESLAVASGKTMDELYAIAQDNMMKRIPHEAHLIDTPLGPIKLVGSEVFGGAYIALMGQMAEGDARYLVACPTRDEFLFFKPNEWNRGSAEQFLAFCINISKASPNYFVYPFVLEYQNGEYRDLCEFVDGEVRYCRDSFND